MRWKKVKLKELYEVHNGLSKGRKYFGTGYPFLSFSTVFNNYFIPDEITDFVQSTEKEQENYSIKRGDVFVTRTSETSDELGMSCVALKDYPKATYNGFTKRMRPITGKLLPEYVGYYMRLPSFRAGFQAFSTMTTRASLRNEDLLSLQIAVPPIDVQEKIAGILGAYDDLIENNKKQIILLEEIAQRLYREWFVDLHFPGYEDVEIVNGVPEGWSNAQLDMVGKFRRGRTITRADIVDGDVAVVAGGIEPAYYNNVSNTEAPVITISASGANAGFVRMYYKRVWASDCSYVDKNHTNHIYYLYCFLKDNKVRIDNLQKGAAQPHVYAKDINALEMLVPSSDLLTSFDSAAEPIFTKIKRNIQMRDKLLPYLMIGKLEV